MKIVAISDMHGKLPDIPDCDVLVIAGDICPHFHANYVGDDSDCTGQSDWLRGSFNNWLDCVRAKRVVVTPGNHDWVFEKRPDLVPAIRWDLLIDSSVVIEGKTFYGSPWQPYFYAWAFNAPPAEEGGEEFLRQKWSHIPVNTDVLVVHGPPAGYGDLTAHGDRTGSPSLLEKIKEVQPALSVHGHIHEARGKWEIGRDKQSIIANVSVVNRGYELVHDPMVFEI